MSVICVYRNKKRKKMEKKKQKMNEWGTEKKGSCQIIFMADL